MSWINATYRVRAHAKEIDAVAHALALEQSVEVPLEAVRDPYVAEHIVAQVEALRPVAEDCFDVTLRLATATTGFDTAQLLNMLFGNSSLHSHVELVDAEFPPGFTARFGGPRFGLDGLRTLLQAQQRPLTCAALKPQGLSSAELAKLCERFAAAGVDVIKDDHGLADQAYSPFIERVRACQLALKRCTGHEFAPVYAPSMVGSPRALMRQAEIVRGEGVRMVLIAPALIGMPAFHELVAEHLIGIAVLAHPGYSGATRIAPPFLWGKLFRMLGADAVIYPNHGGRFGYTKQACANIAHACRMPWDGLRPALPVPAGGMSVDRIGEMIDMFGRDVMLLIGGSLLTGGSDAVFERTRDFVRAAKAASSSPAEATR